MPPGAAGRELPLVVMLHGCTQDPDDFAAGTRMNEAAVRECFFVLSPAWAAAHNPQRSWNGFTSTTTRRATAESRRCWPA